jgi:alpha-amylase
VSSGEWEDRVFYEIFVRSFKDSDGDGIGDFNGITSELDYLNDGDPSTTDDLGVTGIWLMPIFVSPSYHGYDVIDYMNVNPDYGTLDDFRHLVEEAHRRGIAVIIDFPINHTSQYSPWFQRSQAGDPEYAGWYIWSDTDPGDRGPWGEKVWYRTGNHYYFALFASNMPDLNLENPDVTREIYDIADFWLTGVGVDGFRLDAAQHLIEDGPVMEDTPETHAWLAAFDEHVHEVTPDAFVIGEVWNSVDVSASYVPSSVDATFDFDLSDAWREAAKDGHAPPLEEALSATLADYRDGWFGTFLTNHDMNRIMSQLAANVDLGKLSATWLLTGPGIPFLYYGEEVGLRGIKPDQHIRTPMPWTPEKGRVGFTTGTPWEAPWIGYETFNVATETSDPDSMLSHYRTLIHLREAAPALDHGDTLLVDTGSEHLISYLRSDEADHVLVVLNLSEDPISDYSLSLTSGPLPASVEAVSMLGPGASAPTVTDGGFKGYVPVESVPGYGALVIDLT